MARQFSTQASQAGGRRPKRVALPCTICGRPVRIASAEDVRYVGCKPCRMLAWDCRWALQSEIWRTDGVDSRRRPTEAEILDRARQVYAERQQAAV